MVTGASQADAAVLFISAKRGEFEKVIEITNQTQEINQEHLVIINTGNISNSQLAIGMNIKQIKISKNRR